MIMFDKCPGCLKRNKAGYCNGCKKKLFQGRRVSPILTFSRPEFNRIKTSQPSRISISGVQPKHSLRLNGKKLDLTDEGREYILKPIPQESFNRISEMP